MRAHGAGPLRAVHLTTSIAPEAGGPAYSIPRLCEHLREAGASVELLTTSTPAGDARTTPHRSFALGRMPARLGHAPGMLQWLNERAAAGGIDILHSHNLWAMPSIYPDRVGRPRIPHIVSPRGTLTRYSMSTGSWTKKIYWPLVQHPVLRRAACFHATAASEIKDLRRLGFRQPVALLPIGVDLPQVPEKAAADTRTILYLGRFHPEKGVGDLLDAWARVHRHRPDWQLRIVGPDSIGYRDALERQADRLRLERVSFAGPRYDAGKYAEYHAASLYVLPSPTENFGVSIAEALASGIPVIANHGAPWEGLVDQGCGWWVPNGVDALSDAIMTATTVSLDERRRMGVRGRAYVERAFGWDRIAGDMLAVYDWILDRGPRPDCVDIVEDFRG